MNSILPLLGWQGTSSAHRPSVKRPLFYQARDLGHRVASGHGSCCRGITSLCTSMNMQRLRKATITRQDISWLLYWAPVLPLLGRLSACKRSDGRPGVMAAAAKASRRWTCRGLRAACD